MRIKNRFIVFCFLLICCFLTSRLVHALDAPWASSTTATADSTVTLCGQYVIGGTTVPAQAWIHAIIIDSAALNSNVELYDSSFTTISTTSSLVLGPFTTTVITAPFVIDSVFRHGLNYVKAGTAVLTILYSCF